VPFFLFRPRAQRNATQPIQRENGTHAHNTQRLISTYTHPRHTPRTHPPGLRAEPLLASPSVAFVIALRRRGHRRQQHHLNRFRHSRHRQRRHRQLVLRWLRQPQTRPVRHAPTHSPDFALDNHRAATALRLRQDDTDFNSWLRCVDPCRAE
jgi:hypothetical protein